MASSVSEDYDMHIRFGCIPRERVFESLEDKLRYVTSGIHRAVELMCWVRDRDKSSDGSCAALAAKAIGLMEGIKSVMGMSMLAHTVYGQELHGLASNMDEVRVTALQMAKRVNEEIECLRKRNLRHLGYFTLAFLINPIAVGLFYNYKLSTMFSTVILLSTVMTYFFGVVWAYWEDQRKKTLINLEQQREFATWIKRAANKLHYDVNNFIVPHIPPPSEPATLSDAGSVN